jgi:flagellar basal body rod protein FlgB
MVYSTEQIQFQKSLDRAGKKLWKKTSPRHLSQQVNFSVETCRTIKKKDYVYILNV